MWLSEGVYLWEAGLLKEAGLVWVAVEPAYLPAPVVADYLHLAEVLVYFLASYMPIPKASLAEQ